ncbi:MAG: methionine--tRNA ligase [Bdellovibrionaceae bacterium]|nr:methionine--tRNA ligase [Pseudobdellovibrionaceae bacterium]
MKAKTILATAALPYANGEVHLGHLLEHLQVDIWCRSQRMSGHDCVFICADDTHGTPIMIRAREEGITPEQLIARAHQEHEKDFKDLLINHSVYSSTNSPENKELCEEFYGKMKAKGHITTRPVEQQYCTHDKMFLPDRFVKGTCPNCGALDQYGDSCEVCGATYNPSELKNPHCYLCGTEPVKKSSDHYFFKLNNFREYLIDWLPKHTQAEVGAKMMEWFKEPLRDWDISRDEPYFGFAIPDTNNSKFFYVWVDAPMGYVASTKIYCKQSGKSFDDYWRTDTKADVYHFIGKDITYFHTLFWPALLKSADFRTPTAVHAHGFITLNGERMSKSRGNFISIRTYLNHLAPEYARYYLATKLNSKVEDMDFNLEDFQGKVNSDLVGKITNLGSRGASMINKNFESKLTEPDATGAQLLKEAQMASEIIEKYYAEREFSKVTNEIRLITDKANKYFDDNAPWKLVTMDPELTQKVLTTTLNLFRMISIYLTPVLPAFSEKVAQLFNEKPYTEFKSVQNVLKNTSIQTYQHLMTRIDPKNVKAMMDESKAVAEKLQALKAKAKTGTKAVTTGTSVKTDAKPAVAAEGSGKITIDDFMKVDLRVAQIIEAEIIPEADKLLRLTVSLGNDGTRQIIAGIRSAYKPEDLKGRLTMIVANLEPRKMKFGMSEGMVLAAGAGGSDLFILSPDSGAKPGQKIK